MSSRAIKQISAATDDDGDLIVVSLCEDSTIWVKWPLEGVWSQIYVEDIPDDKPRKSQDKPKKLRKSR